MAGAKRSALDKLIDGEALAVGGRGGKDAGYLLGWTNPLIPRWVRQDVESAAGAVQLEAWQAWLRDEKRPLAESPLLIFWDDLPLAVWLPAGGYESYLQSPN